MASGFPVRQTLLASIHGLCKPPRSSKQISYQVPNTISRSKTTHVNTCQSHITSMTWLHTIGYIYQRWCSEQHTWSPPVTRAFSNVTHASTAPDKRRTQTHPWSEMGHVARSHWLHLVDWFDCGLTRVIYLLVFLGKLKKSTAVCESFSVFGLDVDLSWVPPTGTLPLPALFFLLAD